MWRRMVRLSELCHWTNRGLQWSSRRPTYAVISQLRLSHSGPLRGDSVSTMTCQVLSHSINHWSLTQQRRRRRVTGSPSLMIQMTMFMTVTSPRTIQRHPWSTYGSGKLTNRRPNLLRKCKSRSLSVTLLTTLNIWKMKSIPNCASW